MLTFAEVGQVLAREESAGSLRPADTQRLRGFLANVRREWVNVHVSESIRRRASQVFPVEPGRTQDAIHLASALEMAEAYPDLEVLSFDRRIQENCRALGFSSLRP